MKLIVGLGNPGKDYEQTRHNVGFQVVESLAGRLNIDLSKKKFESRVGEGRWGAEKVFLALPQTYMNLSGRAVSAIVDFFKISPQDLAVIHDEIDLPLGKLKVVRKGRPAGNRGVHSIQEHLATEEFCRFRIGVGKPLLKDQTADYVLSGFSSDEKRLLNPVLDKVQEGLEIWVRDGIDKAIEFCHRNYEI